MTTESLPAAACAHRLTEALRRCGALGEGRVREVDDDDRLSVL